jgi:hypothetical protein
MANPDLLNPQVRKQIIDEILGEENKSRKAESLERFEILAGRQKKYIVEKLESEFSRKTVGEMRKITSINIAQRVINEQASIYKTEPIRNYSKTNDEQQEHIENIYKLARANIKLKKSNKIFKANQQSMLQVVPADGIIAFRTFWPHQVDVVPDETNPEKAFAVILSVFDKYQYIQGNSNSISDPANVPARQVNPSGQTIDGRNQLIADGDDYKEKAAKRFEVWTNELNFMMDGNGNILSEEVENPIGKLPFVDISIDKDFEFWVRRNNSTFEFTVDQGAMLCDIATIIKLQGYAQAVIYAEKAPTDLTIGPTKVLFMELDPNKQTQPKFEFVSPSPDLGNTLAFYDSLLRVFLTSIGADPKTVSGSLDAKSFSSGVERLLAMIERFEASKDDIDLYRWAEEQVFELVKLWNNAYQGTDVFVQELRGPNIPDDSKLSVKFAEPQSIQTQMEIEDSVIKLREKSLMTKQMAIMKIYGVDEDIADKMLKEIEADEQINVPVQLTQFNPGDADKMADQVSPEDEVADENQDEDQLELSDQDGEA